MEGMDRGMRRIEKALGIDKTIDILENGDFGVLATCGQDGFPYAVPLSYVCYNKMIYFHSALEGHKIDNISYDDNVSFCVVGKTKEIADEFDILYQSVIVFGRASIVKGKEKRRALVLIAKKYTHKSDSEINDYLKANAKKSCVVKIKIKKITGKGTKGLD